MKKESGKVTIDDLAQMVGREFEFMHDQFNLMHKEFGFMHKEFDYMDKEFGYMHQKFDQTDKKIDSLRSEMHLRFDQIRDEVKVKS